jgi:hypothetical protein
MKIGALTRRDSRSYLQFYKVNPYTPSVVVVMEAGIADHVWSLEEILDFELP